MWYNGVFLTLARWGLTFLSRAVAMSQVGSKCPSWRQDFSMLQLASGQTLAGIPGEASSLSHDILSCMNSEEPAGPPRNIWAGGGGPSAGVSWASRSLLDPLLGFTLPLKPQLSLGPGKSVVLHSLLGLRGSCMTCRPYCSLTL